MMGWARVSASIGSSWASVLTHVKMPPLLFAANHVVVICLNGAQILHGTSPTIFKIEWRPNSVKRCENYFFVMRARPLFCWN